MTAAICLAPFAGRPPMACVAPRRSRARGPSARRRRRRGQLTAGRAERMQASAHLRQLLRPHQIPRE
eukprot:1697-Pyramimonas_sp.AAC.1